VAATGKIAAVFSIPRTHRSLQLKGTDAEVERFAQDDLLLVNSYRLAFTEHLHQLGHAPQLIQALMECGPDDLTAVSFTPSAAFSQTPGPHAGQAVGAAT